MGVSAKETPDKTPVSFVLIDNNHLTEQGVRCFCALSKEFVPVTSNADHPAFQVKEDNLHIIYQSKPSLPDALATRKPEYGCQSIPIQTGGTRNGLFPREKLFGYIDLVVAPILIGGKETSALMDGKFLFTEREVSLLGVRKLQECMALENSDLGLRYKVVNGYISIPFPSTAAIEKRKTETARRCSAFFQGIIFLRLYDRQRPLLHIRILRP